MEEAGGEAPPEIDYSPDTSIRDLRGPAVALVTRPSNRLLLACVLGACGWLALLVIILIPVAFPLERNESNEEVDLNTFGPPGSPAREAAERKFGKKRGQGQKSFFTLFGFDLSAIADWPGEQVAFALLIPILGAIYSSCAAAGAVQMQKLASREWGKAGCILAMIPVNAVGLGVVVALLLRAGLGVFGIPEDVLTFPLIGIIFGLCLGSLAAGVSALTALDHHDVIAGFEYRPE
jgi:hypothetical protein